jgi:hypothetical protein
MSFKNFKERELLLSVFLKFVHKFYIHISLNHTVNEFLELRFAVFRNNWLFKKDLINKHIDVSPSILIDKIVLWGEIEQINRLSFNIPIAPEVLKDDAWWIES